MEEQIDATSQVSPEEPSLEETVESILAPSHRENPVYIDDLEDAIEFDPVTRNAFFKPKPGEQVVIERWSGDRWLGTTLYTVRYVDVKTGNIGLHDDDNKQAAMANIIAGPMKHGWRFKLPIPGLRLDKREPPKAVPLKVERPVNADGTKPRGRPKGSKNRSPEEIARDRAAQAAEKLQKQRRIG